MSTRNIFSKDSRFSPDILSHLFEHTHVRDAKHLRNALGVTNWRENGELQGPNLAGIRHRASTTIKHAIRKHHEKLRTLLLEDLLRAECPEKNPVTGQALSDMSLDELRQIKYSNIVRECIFPGEPDYWGMGVGQVEKIYRRRDWKSLKNLALQQRLGVRNKLDLVDEAIEETSISDVFRIISMGLHPSLVLLHVAKDIWIRGQFLRTPLFMYNLIKRLMKYLSAEDINVLQNGKSPLWYIIQGMSHKLYDRTHREILVRIRALLIKAGGKIIP